MDKSVELKYGTTRICLALPVNAHCLAIREPQKTASEAVFGADLDDFLAPHSLAGCRIAVVVADKTRLCAYDRYLPVLLDRIEARGAKPADITLYIAYGTHQAQSDTESRAAYGAIFAHYRFVHHDCTDASLFQDFGRTSRGTPVRLRKDILAADYTITFGAISHHYFAGYGGGRKLIFPGLGEQDAIYRNHRLFLNPQQGALCTDCRSGCLDGNPLAEDLVEIEGHRPVDLAIHGILDSHGEVCRLMVGRGMAHFRKACDVHGDNCEITADTGYHTVVASCGGYPKDINFIQAHKAIQHASAFVNDGGTLIIFAQCRDGVGSSTFLPWFDMGWAAAFDRLAKRYQGNGGTALAMMEKTRRINIGLVTDLSPDICRTMGVERLDKAAAAAAIISPGATLAIIPNASLLVRGKPGAD